MSNDNVRGFDTVTGSNGSSESQEQETQASTTITSGSSAVTGNEIDDTEPADLGASNSISSGSKVSTGAEIDNSDDTEETVEASTMVTLGAGEYTGAEVSDEEAEDLGASNTINSGSSAVTRTVSEDDEERESLGASTSITSGSSAKESATIDNSDYNTTANISNSISTGVTATIGAEVTRDEEETVEASTSLTSGSSAKTTVISEDEEREVQASTAVTSGFSARTIEIPVEDLDEIVDNAPMLRAVINRPGWITWGYSMHHCGYYPDWIDRDELLEAIDNIQIQPTETEELKPTMTQDEIQQKFDTKSSLKFGAGIFNLTAPINITASNKVVTFDPSAYIVANGFQDYVFQMANNIDNFDLIGNDTNVDLNNQATGLVSTGDNGNMCYGHTISGFNVFNKKVPKNDSGVVRFKNVGEVAIKDIHVTKYGTDNGTVKTGAVNLANVEGYSIENVSFKNDVLQNFQLYTILVTNCNDGYINQTTAKNISYGMSLLGSNIYVTNSNINGSKYGINISENADNITIDGGTIVSEFYGVKFECENLNINNLKIEAQTGIGTYDGSNTRINNCYIEATNGIAAMRAGRKEGLYVTGNRINASTCGLYIVDAERSIFSENTITITQNMGTGIDLKDSDFSVNDQLILDNIINCNNLGQNGIVLTSWKDGVNNAIISGNTIKNSVGVAIIIRRAQGNGMNGIKIAKTIFDNCNSEKRINPDTLDTIFEPYHVPGPTDMTEFITIKIVDTLPTTDIDKHTIYLVPIPNDPDNVHEQYLYVDDQWVMCGTTRIDLSDYYTKLESDDKFAEIDHTHLMVDITDLDLWATIDPTMDATQIQEVFDNNRIIHAVEGDYNLTKQINVPLNNTNVVFEQGASFTVNFDAADVDSNYVFYSPTGVEGLVLEGSNTDVNLNETAVGLLYKEVSPDLMKGIKVSGFNLSKASQPKNNYLNCIVLNQCAGYELKDLTFSECSFDIGSADIYVESCEQGSISNVSSELSFSPVRISGGDHNTVSSFDFKDCSYGIYVINSDYATVENGELSSIGSNDILVGSNHVNINNVSIGGTNDNGIYLSDGANDISVDNCQIRNVRVGINSENISELKVMNCIFETQSVAGINLVGADSSYVSNNKFIAPVATPDYRCIILSNLNGKGNLNKITYNIFEGENSADTLVEVEGKAAYEGSSYNFFAYNHFKDALTNGIEFVKEDGCTGLLENKVAKNLFINIPNELVKPTDIVVAFEPFHDPGEIIERIELLEEQHEEDITLINEKIETLHGNVGYITPTMTADQRQAVLDTYETVYILKGDYNIDVTMNITRSGTSIIFNDGVTMTPEVGICFIFETTPDLNSITIDGNFANINLNNQNVGLLAAVNTATQWDYVIKNFNINNIAYNTDANSIITVSNCDKLLFENIKMENTTASGTNGISCNNCYHATFENIYANYIDYPICIVTCDNVYVNNSKLYNSKNGIYASSITLSKFVNNAFRANNYGIYLTGSKNNVVSNNIFNTSGNGIWIHAEKETQFSCNKFFNQDRCIVTSEGGWVDDCSFTDNDFIDFIDCGISGALFSRCQFNNNRFNTSGDANSIYIGYNAAEASCAYACQFNNNIFNHNSVKDCAIYMEMTDYKSTDFSNMMFISNVFLYHTTAAVKFGGTTSKCRMYLAYNNITSTTKLVANDENVTYKHYEQNWDLR